MSHDDTTIELADGLTVLIGPNNCGKSAVVAAYAECRTQTDAEKKNARLMPRVSSSQIGLAGFTAF